MNKDIIPEDYTLGLALFDAIPVFLFGAACLLLWRMTSSIPILIGGIICFIAGILKVVWKIIVVVMNKNIWPLFMQMRIGMPAGFILIIAGVAVGAITGSGRAFFAAMAHFIPLVLLAVSFIGLFGMIMCSRKLDSVKASSNWIEEICNTLAQGAFLASMIVAYTL